MSERRFGFSRLPLVAKLLVPFLALMLFVGAFGVFLIVRDLGSRAQAALDADLAQRTLDARSILRDRELYILESANFAANIEGLARAIRANDRASTARLMQSVVALKRDLNFVAVTDARGAGLVQFVRRGDTAPIRRDSSAMGEHDVVKRALGADGRTKSSGLMRIGGVDILAIAGPVCSVADPCASVGTAVVGINVDELAAAAARSEGTGVVLSDTTGRLLTRVAPDARTTDITTLRTPYDVQGRRIGTLALSVPTAEALSTARRAGLRLAFVIFAAMIGVVAIGYVLTRKILAQVRPLVETNRALGRGELEARAPVLSSDELGELARGVNQMAEQLQASYETLELRVAQRTEEVQRLLKERTEFFAALSHELRTPLAVIRGQAKMMIDPSYPKGEKWVSDTGGVIDGSAEQLLSVVNDVLELARAEAGRLEIDLDAVDLPDVVRDLRPTIEGLARAGGLRVGIKVPPDLPAVRADRDRLREVIVNLVDNAAKYTPEGGRVDLSATARNGSVVVSVKDTGVGIPPESGEFIFEPFYRVRGTKPQQGQASSGLGLALAKRVVEAQGGTISFDSKVGKGSTFTFTLELAKAKRKRKQKARR